MSTAQAQTRPHLTSRHHEPNQRIVARAQALKVSQRVQNDHIAQTFIDLYNNSAKVLCLDLTYLAEDSVTEVLSHWQHTHQHETILEPARRLSLDGLFKFKLVQLYTLEQTATASTRFNTVQVNKCRVQVNKCSVHAQHIPSRTPPWLLLAEVDFAWSSLQ